MIITPTQALLPPTPRIPHCPVCGSDAVASLICGEYLIECGNPDCAGPDTQSQDAALSFGVALADWCLAVGEHMQQQGVSNG